MCLYIYIWKYICIHIYTDSTFSMLCPLYSISACLCVASRGLNPSMGGVLCAPLPTSVDLITLFLLAWPAHCVCSLSAMWVNYSTVFLLSSYCPFPASCTCNDFCEYALIWVLFYIRYLLKLFKPTLKKERIEHPKHVGVRFTHLFHHCIVIHYDFGAVGPFMNFLFHITYCMYCILSYPFFIHFDTNKILEFNYCSACVRTLFEPKKSRLAVFGSSLLI